jgi:hypothetical protein
VSAISRNRGEILQIDQRRQQREIEQHRLRIAHRQQQPATQQFCALSAHRLRRRRDGGRMPQFPGEIEEVGGAEVFQNEKERLEQGGQSSESEHRRRQPQNIAEHQAEHEPDHARTSACQDAREHGGDRRSGRGGGQRKHDGEGGQHGPGQHRKNPPHLHQHGHRLLDEALEASEASLEGRRPGISKPMGRASCERPRNSASKTRLNALMARAPQDDG